MGKLMKALGMRGTMPGGDMKPDEDSETPVSETGSGPDKLEPKGDDGAAPEVHAFRLFNKAKDEGSKVAALKAFVHACSGMDDSDY